MITYADVTNYDYSTTCTVPPSDESGVFIVYDPSPGPSVPYEGSTTAYYSATYHSTPSFAPVLLLPRFPLFADFPHPAFPVLCRIAFRPWRLLPPRSGHRWARRRRRAP